MLPNKRPSIMVMKLEDYCINCSKPLSPGDCVREIDLGLNYNQECSSSMGQNFVDVKTVLSDLYKLDHLSMLNSNFGHQKSLGVCARCGNMLKNLYMNQRLFTQVRTSTSYLGKKVNELNSKLQELHKKIIEFEKNPSFPGHRAKVVRDKCVQCTDADFTSSTVDNITFINLVKEEEETRRRRKRLALLSRFKQLRAQKDDPLSTIIDDHNYLRNENTMDSHGGGDDFDDDDPMPHDTPVVEEEIVVEQDTDNDGNSKATEPAALRVRHNNNNNHHHIDTEEDGNRRQPVVHYVGDDYDLLQFSLPPPQLPKVAPAAVPTASTSVNSTTTEPSTDKTTEVFTCECDARFKKKKNFENHRKVCSLRKKAIIVFRLGARRHQQDQQQQQQPLNSKNKQSSTRLPTTLEEAEKIIESAFAWHQGPVQPKLVNGPLDITPFCDPRHRFYCHLCKEQWEHNGLDFFAHLTRLHSCHTCPLCPHLFFLNNSDWKEHVIAKHPNGCTLLVCLSCGTACAGQEEMRLHTQQCCKCEICGKLFKGQAIFNQHYKFAHQIGSKNKYQCRKCGHQSLTKHDLQLHILGNHAPKKYCCTHTGCPESFALKTELNSHLQTHQRSPLPISPTNKGHVHCMFCGQHFVWRGSVLIHIQSKHTEPQTFPCSEENCREKFATQTELVKHRKMKHFKGYKCRECDKIFFKSYQIRNHMEKEHISKLETVQRCSMPNCPRMFATEEQLKSHMDNCKGREARFSCDECEKSFYWKYHLTYHKLRHANVKRFQCSHCNKGFNNKYPLRNHEATHSEVPTVPCPVDGCEKKCFSKHHLSRHMEAHEERSLCTTCGYSCKSKAKFRKHVRKHNNDDEEMQQNYDEEMSPQSPPPPPPPPRKPKARKTGSKVPAESPPAKKKKVPVSPNHRRREKEKGYSRKIRFQRSTNKTKRYKYY